MGTRVLQALNLTSSVLQFEFLTTPIFSYLKDNGLIILFEVEGKDVSVHECGTTLAEDVDCFLQELHLDP